MKFFLMITALFLAGKAQSQSSDFILLKQKNKTIATYFKGTTIQFISHRNAFVEGSITDIRNDSIFLKGYIIRQMPTQLGVYILDTTYYYTDYPINNIKAISKTGRHFDWQGSGSVLIGGSILLTVASGVVYLADKDRFSPELLIAAVGLGGVGYLLTRLSGKGMVIGKKYKLVYVKANPQR